MRSICKKGSVTLVVVIALCALTAASASAAQWYVGGKALSGSQALSSSVKVEEGIELTSINREKHGETWLAIKCSSAEDFNGTMEITAPATLSFPHFLELHNCAVKTNSDEICGVRPYGTDAEESLDLNADVIKPSLGTAPEDSGTFEPAKGTLLSEGFELNHLAGACLFEGDEYNLVGTVPVNLPTGQTEATEQEIVFDKATGLTISKDPTYLTGKIKLKLASGAKWSLH